MQPARACADSRSLYRTAPWSGAIFSSGEPERTLARAHGDAASPNERKVAKDCAAHGWRERARESLDCGTQEEPTPPRRAVQPPRGKRNLRSQARVLQDARGEGRRARTAPAPLQGRWKTPRRIAILLSPFVCRTCPRDVLPVLDVTGRKPTNNANSTGMADTGRRR